MKRYTYIYNCHLRLYVIYISSSQLVTNKNLTLIYLRRGFYILIFYKLKLCIYIHIYLHTDGNGLHSASILLRVSCYIKLLHEMFFMLYKTFPFSMKITKVLNSSILAECNFFIHYRLYVSCTNWALWIVGNRTTII